MNDTLFVNQNIKPIQTKYNKFGNLEISGCDVTELAKKYKTPLYVMDKPTMVKMAQDYIDAFSCYEKVQIMYASKALMTGSVARVFNSMGFGFDVVSMGEIYTLLNAGVDLSKSSFNGNNKTVDEIEFGIEHNIDHFSVDSLFELKLINNIAKAKGKIQKIHLRINPRIQCHTHEYIQTGKEDSKFGLDLDSIAQTVKLINDEYKNLYLAGLHAHVGSQIFETKIYHDEVEVLMLQIKKIKDAYNINIDEINIGGGLGVTYTKNDNPPSVYDIADTVINAIENCCQKYNLQKPNLYIEPGRSLVSTAGFSLYTIGSEKNIAGIRKYVSVDGGMADNPRPSIYKAGYCAELANGKEINQPEIVTVAGKFCESGDILIRDIELNNPTTGDILCVYNTGAYCYSMSSNYNGALKPAMIMIDNGKSEIIIKRQSIEQLVQNDIITEK